MQNQDTKTDQDRPLRKSDTPLKVGAVIKLDILEEFQSAVRTAVEEALPGETSREAAYRFYKDHDILSIGQGQRVGATARMPLR
jgi:hypothetical protein